LPRTPITVVDGPSLEADQSRARSRRRCAARDLPGAAASRAAPPGSGANGRGLATVPAGRGCGPPRRRSDRHARARLAPLRQGRGPREVCESVAPVFERTRRSTIIGGRRAQPSKGPTLLWRSDEDAVTVRRTDCPGT
jgi:hypothetical protein